MDIHRDARSPAQQYSTIDDKLTDLKQVNWHKAPRQWKLYRGCELIAVGYAPQETEPEHTPHTLSSGQIGQLLNDVYGLTRIQWWQSAGPTAPQNPDGRLSVVYRRPVPSGGGLCTCEVYLLVGAGYEVPSGVYHYDAVHHALDTLRTGDYAAVLGDTLASPPAHPSSLAVLVSCCFWKNRFKYGDLSYRVQSMDVGVIAAQVLTLAQRYDLTGTLHYRFLDPSIAHLLGLDLEQESIYAVVTFDLARAPASAAPVAPLAPLPDRAYGQPPDAADRWPLLQAVHHASLLRSPEALRMPCQAPAIPRLLLNHQEDEALTVEVPPLDVLPAVGRRHSSWNASLPTPVSHLMFTQLLRHSTQMYLNDIDPKSEALQHILLFCVVSAVEGISRGIYCYDPDQYTLSRVAPGDMRGQLQSVQVQLGQNAFRASVTLFPVVHYAAGFHACGDRWYRIQNMEVGILI